MEVVKPSLRPLYMQVRDEVLKRLVDGRWPPGTMLPSEHRIGRELGVSQGTVRKALDLLTAAEALVRRQGRGTFVASPGEGQFLFKFFRMVDAEGKRHYPTSTFGILKRKRASPAACRKLNLEKDTEVWEIRRVRDIDGEPTVAEKITVSAERFPGLDAADPLPNNLYVLFAARYGITIHRAVERIVAVVANASDRSRLHCRIGTPLLAVDRVALTLDGTPIEWRVSRCLTDRLHYESLIS